MTELLATAFLLGVAGSAHCVGMCGPIALAVPSPNNAFLTRLGSSLLLNGGRLFTYVLLGMTIGVFGAGMRLVGLQQVTSIAAGIALILSVLIPGLLERWAPTGQWSMAIGRLRGALGRQLGRTAPEAIFFTGMLNGALPCGLVYAALLGAAAQGTVLNSAAFMAAFAMGTVPAMVLFRLSGAAMLSRLRPRMRRLAPALVCTMGVLMILRGANLGVPYLSPAVPQVATQVTACH
ncbi:MAG: sulfite exporter TauE/SafE family protein [Flavobacteriales bacterium]|nr:sulfite exporter TauE/SafE family protein [Flavobacteriales bacterium]HPF90323.1 sulfite exporter TauE/SafE family protein [Flavobacteriales bacterium]